MTLAELTDLALSNNPETRSACPMVARGGTITAGVRHSLAEAQANVEAARIRHDAGRATIADLYQAQAALASAQLNLQQAEGSRIIVDGALAVAVGYTPDTALSLE